MRKNLLIILILLFKLNTNAQVDFQTVCNPVNLSYMFGSEKPSFREGADPSLVLFQDEYYLFISKSGGYFHSVDLINWNLITTSDLPLDNYAPTAVVIGNEVYFMTSLHDRIYKTADPKSGKWEVAKTNFPFTLVDPMLFLDDDGRLYYYGGCSNVDPLQGAEIDPKTLASKGSLKNLIYANTEQNGWEVPGDYNTNTSARPWLEGLWMNKYKGKYYLQYAAPGTEFKSYCDGIYVSDNPLGPFTLAKHNPFAYKPEGFVCGAGHGSTFQDKYGNYWHLGTATISQRHMFERRISLFPVFFDEDNVMYAYTGFGDYPMIIPNKKISAPEELFPEWMLLSYQKEVTVSSSLEGKPAQNAVNENIRTWWSAETGDESEFFMINLEQECDVYALQINFADEGADLSGRNPNIYYQYIVEHSINGEDWEILIDKSNNTEDAPHDYIQLNEKVRTQYLRLINVKMPSGKLSLSGFRVFGKSFTEKPAENSFTTVRRWGIDPRKVQLRWDPTENTTGYNIRYGTDKDKLYSNYIVYGSLPPTISSLNTKETYYFTLDTFNEAGVTRGTEVQTFPNVGIEPIENAFSVYPNPVKDWLNITFSFSDNEEITINLYDLQGRRLKQVQSYSNPIEINLSDYAAGVYFIRVETTNNAYSKKIMLER